MEFKPVTTGEIQEVWGNANFGSYFNSRKIKIIKSSLLKYASGYTTGHTAFRLLLELGLITKKNRLTARGRKQLWEFFGKADLSF